MKTEKQFSMYQDKYGVFYHLTCLDDKVTEAAIGEELCFLGVPKNVLEEASKGPVTFKLTFELQ